MGHNKQSKSSSKSEEEEEEKKPKKEPKKKPASRKKTTASKKKLSKKEKEDEKDDKDEKNEDDEKDKKKKVAPKKGSKRHAKKIVKPAELPDYTELDYWHGNLPNEDTANLLKEDGQYLLRKDTMETKNEMIILSVRSGNQVANAIIKEVPSGFRICDREFDAISKLVDYYQIRKIPINVTETNEVTLGNPCRRKAWELRHKMITVQKELGSGAYGVVYLAQLTYPRQKPITVAAKMLTDMDADSALALWKEARTMQEYDHPNITKFFGVCNDALPYYLVMEFVKGGSVDNYLITNPTLNIFKRTKIAVEAAAGLEYLHAHLCIHRDIAARNLLIDNVAKVSDFGLARKTRNYKVNTEKPMNLRWIAPDVYDSATVNKATDVYAFGITLFELFVVPYDIPYAAWDADEVYAKVIEGGHRLPPPREMPKEIGKLMKECLMEPAVRPQFKMISIYLGALHRQQKADGLEDEGVKKKFKLFK